MDGLKQIKDRGKCCISEKPLKTSKHVNMIQLDRKATWGFPVWGNLLTGQDNMACAYVHDDCIDDNTGKIMGDIKYAVELRGDEFIYHPIETLPTE
jgi:hypothetical protein